jgi:hypothetical protein
MLLSGQRTTLAQSRAAQNFRRRRDPGLLRFVRQESTLQQQKAAKDHQHQSRDCEWTREFVEHMQRAG